MLVESKMKAEILSVPILQERKGLSDPPEAQMQSIRSAVIYLRTGQENLSIASPVVVVGGEEEEGGSTGARKPPYYPLSGSSCHFALVLSLSVSLLHL